MAFPLQMCVAGLFRNITFTWEVCITSSFTQFKEIVFLEDVWHICNSQKIEVCFFNRSCALQADSHRIEVRFSSKHCVLPDFSLEVVATSAYGKMRHMPTYILRLFRGCVGCGLQGIFA